MSEAFDEFKEKSYDNDNNATNIDFSQPIQVDMRDKKPINDPKCKHDFYLDADDPDASWVRVWKCRVCPVGFLVRR